MSRIAIRKTALFLFVGLVGLFVLVPLLGYVGSLIVQAITGHPPSDI